jgi:hypothetical protein
MYPFPTTRCFAAGLLAGLLLLFARTAGAIIVPGSQTFDWDTHPSAGVGDWTVLGSAAGIGEGSGSGGSGDWLQIDFPDVSGDPGAVWYDTIYVPADNLFAGSWDSSMFLEFDFFAEDAPPAGLEVRFGVDGGNTWGFDVDMSGMETDNWQTFQASLSDWEDWRINPFLTEDDYLADLEGLDWIGIYLYRDGPGEHTFGLDDFNLMVPEPAEIAFLGGALAAIMASVRKRKKSPATRDE